MRQNLDLSYYIVVDLVGQSTARRSARSPVAFDREAKLLSLTGAGQYR